LYLPIKLDWPWGTRLHERYNKILQLRELDINPLSWCQILGDETIDNRGGIAIYPKSQVDERKTQLINMQF